jgi:putative membrane protein
MSETASTPRTRPAMGTHLFNAFRGGLIGTAEVVPGVSGGTVALVIGIYDRLIISAGHVLSGIRITATDLPAGKGAARAGAEFRKADWPLMLAVIAGMFTAVILAAKLVAPFVETHPQRAYALFFGLGATAYRALSAGR